MGGGCTAAKERQNAEEAGRRGIINDPAKKAENQGAAHGNRAARKAEIERGEKPQKGNDLREGNLLWEKDGGAKYLLFCGNFCKNGELWFCNSFVFYQSGGFTHKKGRSGEKPAVRLSGDWIRGGRTAAKPMPEQWKPGAAGKSGKANAATAGTRSGKAIGSDSREAGRDAGKRKRVNSARGWTVDKSGKNDKRSGRGTFGWRLHGGKGAAKGRRSGTARDHKQSGKKIENQSAAHGNRTARKAKTKAGGKP